MARVYELVVRHCIASVSKDAVFRSTRVDFVVDSMNEKGGFTLRGKELASPGFLAVLMHKGMYSLLNDGGIVIHRLTKKIVLHFLQNTERKMMMTRKMTRKKEPFPSSMKAKLFL